MHQRKKNVGQTEVAERHAIIQQVHEAVPGRSIRHLCELLEVNRAWYYARPTEEEAVDPDVEVRDAIEQLVLDFPGYGYRRVTAALHRAGWNVNHKRVLRVMREESLLCQLKRHLCRPPTRIIAIRSIPIY